MFRVVIALIFMQLTACSLSPSIKSKPVTLTFSEPKKIQFQGKGAGAGIALMSTMGPMGIALGAAIDEGIAKNIRKAIEQEQADIQSQIKKQISLQLEQHGYSVLLASEKLAYPKIVIKRFGFKVTNGSTDATAAEWDIELQAGSGIKTTLNYPKDFKKDEINTYVLADLKNDGKLGLKLLLGSLVPVLDEVALRLSLK